MTLAHLHLQNNHLLVIIKTDHISRGELHGSKVLYDEMLTAKCFFDESVKDIVSGAPYEIPSYCCDFEVIALGQTHEKAPGQMQDFQTHE